MTDEALAILTELGAEVDRPANDDPGYGEVRLGDDFDLWMDRLTLHGLRCG